MNLLEIIMAALALLPTGSKPAVRETKPPPPPVVAEATFVAYCPQYDHLLVEEAPPGGWDLNRMSFYMHRESRCHPDVKSGAGAIGLLQIMPFNAQLAGLVPAQLYDPRLNVRAAAATCTYWRNTTGNCYQPWAT